MAGRTIATLLLVACLSGSGALAAAQRTIPYAEMHQVLARVAKLQGGKYLAAKATFSSSDPAIPTERIELVIRSRRGAIRVPVTADGVADFPLRDDLLAENPDVATNVPAGKLQMDLSIVVESPPQQRFRYALIAEMSEEAETIFARQGLLARMFTPDYEGLLISFGAGSSATVTVVSADGRVRLAADAKGNVFVADRRDWRRENPWVELSEMPKRMALRAE